MSGGGPSTARKTTPARKRSAAANPPGAAGPITADASLATAGQNAAYFKKLLMGMTHGDDSVRELDYKGHHVVVKTTYDVTIDGKPFHAGLGGTNDAADSRDPARSRRSTACLSARSSRASSETVCSSLSSRSSKRRPG